FLNQTLTNDIRKLVAGQGQYTLLCNERGGVIDDLYAYRLAERQFLLIVNASRIEADAAWLQKQQHAFGSGARVRNVSEEMGAVALQGPRSIELIDDCFQGPSKSGTLVGRPSELAKNHIAKFSFESKEVWVSRTGYTGEDGFELYVAPERAEALWERLLDDGASEGLVPVGLGARDTLRLEKGLMLYGNDIDETTTPLEAGLGWVVKLDKGDFIGREALARQKAEGLRRRLVGLTMDESAPPPRHGYAVKRAGRSVGVVTSGTQSPTLGRGIALAIVESPSGEIGTRLEVEIRSRQHPGEVVPLPFVRRRK
ncbi:MAG TPA: glycine cleavage system aminomethyltransferase GcvT, partial [Candidatus Binatia bacterium]|nr:glycine cleavage system aminomethyltransferase GcvT [Candidatus Binatia bacterium]